MISGLKEQKSYYDQSLRLAELYELAAKRSDGEVTMIFLTPLLLSLALAIRITKVRLQFPTGPLVRHFERRRVRRGFHPLLRRV